MPMTSAERKAKQRKRNEALGFIERSHKYHKDWHDDITAYIAECQQPDPNKKRSRKK